LSIHCVIKFTWINSDAYKIPNKWIQYEDTIRGNNTKFYDYFESVKREDKTFLNGHKYVKIPINQMIEEIMNVSIEYDINILSENMFFDHKGIKPSTKYFFEKLCDREKVI